MLCKLRALTNVTGYITMSKYTSQFPKLQMMLIWICKKGTFYIGENKGSDEQAHLYSLVRDFAVRIHYIRG